MHFIQSSMVAVISLLYITLLSCSTMDESKMEMEDTSDALVEVVAVSVSGTEGAYSLSVTLVSYDTGCDQYANWWEVLDASGELIYRRILGHSHVNEQPFARSGGPVGIAADQLVYIRGHMNNTGYSTSVMSGTVEGGFKKESLAVDFASEAEEMAPQPGDCPF